jgi:hypothetical protein
MPRINSNLKNSVFFLYATNPESGEIAGPFGTGVFIGISRSDVDPIQERVHHLYAVTCHHVAVSGGASIIRINTKDGKSRLLELDPDEWFFDPNGDDLAVVDVTDRIDHEQDEVALVPENWLMEREYIKNLQIDIGEDGFMLGLFASVPGEKRNAVAARFGNLSLLAQGQLPIKTGFVNKRPAHLFDMHSRPGYSGSPVFIYRTPGGDLRRVHLGAQRRSDPITANPRYINPEEFWDQKDNTLLRMLGIHTAQFHDTVEAKKGDPFRHESGAIVEGDRLSIPNSMSVVAPSWAIRTLLHNDFLIEQRLAREAAEDAQNEPTAKIE